MQANYLYFGLISLFCCVAAMVGGSLSSPAPSAQQLDGLTYASAIEAVNAAETARKAAQEMQPLAGGGGDGGAGGGAADSAAGAGGGGPEPTAYEKAERWAGENFDDLIKWGSVTVVALLAVMLVVFA